jgi:surface protein
MKILDSNNFISEKLNIQPITKTRLGGILHSHKFFPTSKNELREILGYLIYENDYDWNKIDTSKITDMSRLFCEVHHLGDITYWDVSNVENMEGMFHMCDGFDTSWDKSGLRLGDISKWNVSKVKNMKFMFADANGLQADITKWNVSSVEDMSYMFYNTDFNQDISKWNVSKVRDMSCMFRNTSKFDADISDWAVGNVERMNYMFYEAIEFSKDLSNWCAPKATHYKMFDGNPLEHDIEKHPKFN